jgi:hypothetical protein
MASIAHAFMVLKLWMMPSTGRREYFEMEAREQSPRASLAKERTPFHK